MSAVPSFDDQLAAALPGGPTAIADVLLPRVALGLCPEDASPPDVLQVAARECEVAGMAHATAGQPVMVAIAQIARAAALLLLDRLDTIEAAERSLANALSLVLKVQPDAPPRIQVEAFLLMAELMAHVAGTVPTAQRDGFIDRGLAVARSAEYLCAVHPAYPSRARAVALQAKLLAGRFGSVRDRALMDSIDHGQRAFALLGQGDVLSAPRWPMLLLTMGNAALSIASGRAAWVPQALRHYTMGRGLVDVERHPRLAAVFDGNLALWQGEGAEQSLIDQLPPPEQRARAARAPGEAKA